MLIWLTGLSGSGKSTLARQVFETLAAAGCRVELLDADEVRAQLSSGLGFSKSDREENVRRLGYVGGLLRAHGVIVLVAAMSPYRAGRDEIRKTAPSAFVEVFVDAPLAICEERDPIGLYRRFRAGEVHNLSGLDAPYEPPLNPEVHCHTAQQTIEESVADILKTVRPFLA
ncbi:adenylyl-sulfate kinase [Granulicella tundricola]|uniref:Adenylyl-sulfate kinase n=1 Tax=Granulicella tundricola (strain ATCC BAA-1859 / DSM 23138 / MP5ACTX9) TaxID=1198114 RepID=E8X101_GRATM|nr:adenylyl-sulfate kinase [Granulicella tundricola]ADW67867.1 adenylylsulfate kinase [Granulicella tundricola MP5ACTX9]